MSGSTCSKIQNMWYENNISITSSPGIEVSQTNKPWIRKAMIICLLWWFSKKSPRTNCVDIEWVPPPSKAPITPNHLERAWSRNLDWITQCIHLYVKRENRDVRLSRLWSVYTHLSLFTKGSISHWLVQTLYTTPIHYIRLDYVFTIC